MSAFLASVIAEAGQFRYSIPIPKLSHYPPPPEKSKRVRILLKTKDDEVKRALKRAQRAPKRVARVCNSLCVIELVRPTRVLRNSNKKDAIERFRSSSWIDFCSVLRRMQSEELVELHIL